ncbi:integrase [Clostridia bacterium]|nr:integrase [Clostridia bacterium]
MKISACYIRVSTAEQTEYSPESQLRLIRDYAAKNDIVIPEGLIFRDEGISGRDAGKRPAFLHMISAAKRKDFECILVYSTSRFARNHEQSVVYRSMLEKEYGVEVISITQPNIDKKTDMLTTAIYSIMDEWYSMDLAENVKRGMTQKAMEGGYQAKPPFGYKLLHKGEVMVVDEEESVIIRCIFDEFLAGKSCWAIAKDLAEQGIRTKQNCKLTQRRIKYILRNSTYIGVSHWNPTGRSREGDFKDENIIMARGKYVPIISEEIFNEAQIKLDEIWEKNKHIRPQELTRHWLSGLLKCSECGKTLSSVTSSYKNSKIYNFRCSSYGRGTCENPNYISTKKIEKYLFEYLKKLYVDSDTLYKINIAPRRKNVNEKVNLENEIKKHNAKFERAKQAYLNGLFDMQEYEKVKKQCSVQINNLYAKLEQSKNNVVDYINLQKKIKDLYDLITNSEISKDEKQSAIRAVIEKIIIDKKANEIKVCFFEKRPV